MDEVRHNYMMNKVSLSAARVKLKMKYLAKAYCTARLMFGFGD
jgi:hypothetical protein